MSTRLLIHTPAANSRLSPAEAIAKGEALTAACGKVWVPQYTGSDIPAGTPTCTLCSRSPWGIRTAALPHYVYRYFDAAGRLLYVGCTKNPVDRDKQHRRSSAWYADVASVRRIVFPDRAYALRMEKRAIQEENPEHNRALRVAS